MSAVILDGRKLAERLRAELKAKAVEVTATRGCPAQLTLVAAGEDPTALLYGAHVQRSCARIGLNCMLRRYPESIAETELRVEVAALGARGDVDGVALLLPLPEHIEQRMVTEVLPPHKDVDGLGPRNAGYLMLGVPQLCPQHRGRRAGAAALRGHRAARDERGRRGP